MLIAFPLYCTKAFRDKNVLKKIQKKCLTKVVACGIMEIRRATTLRAAPQNSCQLFPMENAKSRLEINSNRLLDFRKETKNNDLKFVACQVGIEPTLSRLTAACFTY